VTFGNGFCFFLGALLARTLNYHTYFHLPRENVTKPSVNYCCLEVKERGGDYNKAITQLEIWCAAGLERLA
jgi:hypothetical protein